MIKMIRVILTVRMRTMMVMMMMIGGCGRFHGDSEWWWWLWWQWHGQMVVVGGGYVDGLGSGCDGSGVVMVVTLGGGDGDDIG